MRIFITGGSGLLGEFLNLKLSQNHKILSAYNNNEGICKNFNSIKLDIGNQDALGQVFTDFRPDVVIHTAAYSRPEICDKLSRNEVYRINVEATIQIAKLCSANNAKLIFTSTDLVYDGRQGQMLGENARLNPVSLYAESKLMAERGIMEIFSNYVILRTSLLYGISKNESVNNFQMMYNNFKNGKPARLFYDQFRTPLSLINASEIIFEITEKNITNEIINFAGNERVSRVELGKKLCDVAGFDKSLIEEISMDDIPGLPKVPDVSLNTDKLKSFGLKQKSIEESIYEILRFSNG